MAKPADALAQVNPAMPPQLKESAAITTRSKPILSISFGCTLGLFLIVLTKLAVMNGIKTSIITSATIKIKVNIVGFLYSLTLFVRRFIIKNISLSKVRLIN